MLMREMNKELVFQCGEQMKALLPSELDENQQLLKKGLLLFRKGHVYNAELHETIITANVQDMIRVSVKLDLEDVSASTCTCPARFLCRHILALFLYVYAATGDIGSFLEAWKNEQPRTKLKSFEKAGLLQKGTRQKAETVQGWYDYFENELAKHIHTALSPAALWQTLFYRYYGKIKRTTPLKEELKKLYQLHAAIFTMKKMLESLHETHVSDFMLEQIAYPFIDQLREDIYMKTAEVKNIAHSFTVEDFLSDSIFNVRELLFASEYFRFERVMVYRHIWLYLLNRKDWVKEEYEYMAERLKEEIQEKGPFIIESDIAAMNALFLQNEDDIVMERLDLYSDLMLPYSFDWIGYITGRREWQRLRKWSAYFFRHITGFLQEDLSYGEKRQTVSFLLTLISEYEEHTGDKEFFERACQKMLPFSYAEYHYFLMEEGDYETWTELQQMVGFPLHEMERTILKTIEKEAPDKLLPLLHDEVEHFILEKNRSSYKQAVKYLKQLKRIYKKLKRTEVWESYLQKLIAKHKRLRAFQEELKKGKLLDA
jgi:hypothetical protein